MKAEDIHSMTKQLAVLLVNASWFVFKVYAKVKLSAICLVHHGSGAMSKIGLSRVLVKQLQSQYL